MIKDEGGIIGIMEGDILESDSADNGSHFRSIFRIPNLHLGLEQFQNSFAARHRGLQGIEAAAQVADRLEETVNVQHKGNQHPRRDRLAQHCRPTHINHHRRCQRTKNIHHGRINRRDLCCVEAGLVEIAVDVLSKIQVIMFLTRKRLHHAHPVDILRQRGICPRDSSAHFTIIFARRLTEGNRRPNHQRQNGKGQQGQFQVKRQHGNDRANNAKQIPHNRQNRPGNKFAQCANVIDDARDDSSHAVAVVKTKREFLQVIEHGSPHVIQDVLSHARHDSHAEIIDNQLCDGHCEENQHNPFQRRRVIGADSIVDCQFYKIRTRH